MRPAASRTPAPDCHVECLAMKLVGELDAGNRHVQFDERGRETECWPSAPSHRARPRLYRRRPCATSALMSAVWGKADSLCSARVIPSLTRSRHQWSEAITTNDCCGNVSLPPASIEWSRREAASSAIDMIMRSRSGAPLSLQERSHRRRRKRAMAVAPVNHETDLRMKNAKI